MAKAIVTGWKGLDKALAGLEAKVQRQALRSALRVGAKRIQATAAENIIQSPSVDTGNLRNSLKVRAAKRSRTKIGMEVSTGGAAHANLVEYGTKHMPAEPFLRPAGYGNRDLIRSMLIDDVADAIERSTDRWKFQKKAGTAARKAERKAKRASKKVSKRVKKIVKGAKRVKKNLSKRSKKLTKTISKKYKTTTKNLQKRFKTNRKRRRARRK